MRSLKQETDHLPRTFSCPEPPAGSGSPVVTRDEAIGETRVFVPWALRYRAAQRRVIRGRSSRPDRRLAAQCFARSIEQLQLLGLQGSGLTIAAEYMAKATLNKRLRGQPRHAHLRVPSGRPARSHQPVLA